MKKNPSIFLLLITAVVAWPMSARAAERWEILRAINWVENPTNQTKVGRFGELGPYQFRPATWRMHTDQPFNLAIRRTDADAIAVKHYEWIKRTFEQAGVEPNAFNIALAWNSGVSSVLKGRAPTVSYNYAERVVNLVEAFQEGRRALDEQKTVTFDNQTEPVPVILDNGEPLRFRVLQDPPRFVIAG